MTDVRCRESLRIDADRVCSLWVGLSPSTCPPCARSEPWNDEEVTPASGVVWIGPSRFTSLPMLAFHVKLMHGQWLGDVRTLKKAVVEHAAMHGQFPKDKNGQISDLDAELAEMMKATPPTGVTPHIHEDVESWSMMKMEMGGSRV